MAIHLFVELFARQHHLIGVDDDDVIAGVNMRRKGGLVLAAQKHGDLRRQAAQHHPFRVDHIPSALDAGRLGHIRIHGKTLQCEMVHSRLAAWSGRHTALWLRGLETNAPVDTQRVLYPIYPVLSILWRRGAHFPGKFNVCGPIDKRRERSQRQGAQPA